MMHSIAAWQPHLSISGCVAAFDMTRADSYTVTGGNTVTSITNLVSGVAWTESTNPPTYEAGGMNGLPCMRGNASNKRIISTEAAVVNAFAGNDLPSTMLVALSPVAATTSLWIFGAANSAVATNDCALIGRLVGAGRYRLTKVDPTGAPALSVSRSVDPTIKPSSLAFVIHGTTGSIWLDNESAANPSAGSIDVNAITPNRVAFFCRPDSSPDGFVGDGISEFYIYTSALTGPQNLRVRTRMMAKFGMAA